MFIVDTKIHKKKQIVDVLITASYGGDVISIDGDFDQKGSRVRRWSYLRVSKTVALR